MHPYPGKHICIVSEYVPVGRLVGKPLGRFDGGWDIGRGVEDVGRGVVYVGHGVV